MLGVHISIFASANIVSNTKCLRSNVCDDTCHDMADIRYKDAFLKVKLYLR